jgi:hypothetical protein
VVREWLTGLESPTTPLLEGTAVLPAMVEVKDLWPSYVFEIAAVAKLGVIKWNPELCSCLRTGKLRRLQNQTHVLKAETQTSRFRNFQILKVECPF